MKKASKYVWLTLVYLLTSLLLVIILGFIPGTSIVNENGTVTFKQWVSYIIVLLPAAIIIAPVLIANMYRQKKRDKELIRMVLSMDMQSAAKSDIAKISSQTAPQQHCFIDQYIVIDIETTGFSRADSQIIEIAANLYQGTKCAARFHTYVNPGIPIPPKITRLTGISDADVAKSPKIDKVKPELLRFLEDIPLVGHNIKSYDIPFLEEKLGVKFQNPIYDTLVMAKCAFPDLPTYKLSYLNEFLNLGGTEYHRAAADVAITSRLYQVCKAPECHKVAISKRLIDDTLATSSNSFCSDWQAQDVKTGLTGKNICFTGEISVSRTRAQELAKSAGATIKSGVSRKLDYLVVGIQDKRVVGETGQSNAQRHAAELIENGNTKLKVINEAEFLELLKPID